MKYCKNCDISYDTPLNQCLLCNNDLMFDDNKKEVYKFKSYKSKPKVYRFIHRLSILMNIVSIVSVIVIDIMINNSLSWSLLVISANVYLIFLLSVIYYKFRWISKIIAITFLTATEVFIIGYLINDYNWALNYIIPAAIISNILLLIFLLIINKQKWISYVATLIFLALAGIATIVLYLTNITTVIWPTLSLFIISIATLLFLFFFSSKEIKEEFIRKFHI